jgi:ubiquinone/menaquinone biosynthesis C-methylase UbiE
MHIDTKDQFDRLADSGTWPSRYDPSAIENYNFITRRDGVRRLLGADRFDAVLDLGCGTGDYCELLSEVASEYVGVDFSPVMIQRATLVHGAPPPGRRPPIFLEGSAESLPFGDNRFDLVVAIGFIEYFRDAEEPMREIVRVMQPGATLVIQSFQVDLFRRIGTATGMDGVKRLAKRAYGALTNTRSATGFSTDRPYTEEQLDELMASFGLMKVAHEHDNYQVLPKTVRRIVPQLNVRGSEFLTPRQPEWLRSLAVNYIGRYRLVAKH